ncbi:hypothetical protein PIB30_034622 [Stylosanthes scabra]|uniref:Uncharacterized protein n=1 Tax=Stylosanthes scabra TaxID=79078 RepID=A0ABU6XEH1_9FABA|nr:hypothetical protein [Stylosanthes scabra]
MIFVEVESSTIVRRTSKGDLDTRFGTRRCAFDDKPYGVAESYSREGVVVAMIHLHLCLWATFMALFFDDLGPWRLVRNIAPTRELEAFGPSLRVHDPFFGLSSGRLCQLPEA